MKRECKVFVVSAVLLLVMLLPKILQAGQGDADKVPKAEVIQRTRKIQMPFIANEGQADEKVKFYANTFGGTVFVTKDGEIVYALPEGKKHVEDKKQEAGWHGLPREHSVEQQTMFGRAEIDNGKSEISDCGLRISDCGIGWANSRLPLLWAGIINNLLNFPASLVQSCNLNQNVSDQATNLDHEGKASRNLALKGSILNNKSPSKICNPKSEAMGVSLKEEIVGGKIGKIKGETKAVTAVNDFRGNDPSKWKTNIPTYEMVNLGEIYEGIELKLKAYGNNVEKLFYVKSGADPEKIRLRLDGAKDVKVTDAGELEVATALGPVKFTKPVAYQEIDGKRVEVDVEYSIQNPEVRRQKQGLPNQKLVNSNRTRTNKFVHTIPLHNPKSEYGFKVAAYDKTRELLIDPLLGSTYLGGSVLLGDDYGNALAIDAGGNIYVAGNTNSLNFPTTTGSYDTSFNEGDGDAFVSKLSGDLTGLIASTYLGGSSGETINSLAIDSGGNIYVAGETYSSDFPTTPGAYDTSNNGISSDAFVSRLSSDLTSLLASTYLGGASSDLGNSLAIDSNGNIYVAGRTDSSDFPTTTDAYDTSYNGEADAFVSRLSGDLTGLLASTFLGGTGGDFCNALAIGADGNIYVTGGTRSPDFPTTPGAYDTYNDYSNDAFVSKLNGDLTDILASTYLDRGDGENVANGYVLIIDAGGNIYATGSIAWKHGIDWAFVSKLTGDLTNLLASTVLDTTAGYGKASIIDAGGNIYVASDDTVYRLNGDLTNIHASKSLNGGSINAIAKDSSKNIYVTGTTASFDFPTTPGAYDTYNGSSNDAFVSKFDGDLTNLLASTYLGMDGASGVDGGIRSIAIDSGGNIYVAGSTGSSDFPTTPGAYDASYNASGDDVFISRLSGDLTSLLASTYLGGSSNHEYVNALAIDSRGNIYVAGETYSLDFPTTSSAYDTSLGGYRDAFVSRLSGDLTSLLASTFLGGGSEDYGNVLAIDSSGNICVAGHTFSSDFPTTPGTYDTSFNGDGDVFVSRLSGDLTSLLASTYLGGSSYYESGNALAIESSGNICVAGYTDSSDFPTSIGAYDTSLGGDHNAFVSRLSGDLTNLLASTYLGGSSYEYEEANDLAIDSNGNVYVTGYTYSSDFPTTPGTYDTSFNGGGDVFVSRLTGDLTSLLASTYLGGSSYYESGNALAIDSRGSIYVAGETYSLDFPTTSSAYDTSLGDYRDAFISKLSGDLTSLLASTYLGGSSLESANALAIGASGDIYVAGDTWSSDFSTTPGAYDTSLGGIFDAFVSKFDRNLSSEIINDLVIFDPIRKTFQTTSDTTGCGDVLGGQFSFDATLKNKSLSKFSLSDLVVNVRELTNGNLLQNADGGAGGVGARLTVPKEGDYADGILSPGESVDVHFIICLTNSNPFRFFVDVLGNKEAVSSQALGAPQSTDTEPRHAKFKKKSRVTRKGFFGRFRPK